MTSQATQTATYEKSVLKNSFCKDVYNLFDIGPRFLQRYLVGSHSTKDHGALAKASDLWSDPVTENYVRFALGCIKRGRAARDIVLSSLPGDFSKRGAKPRFLDVGCAYAGFLVAFAEKDYDVCGVELNEYWASLGQAN